MENITYEQAVEELRSILESLQSGNTSIDDLQKQAKRAAELIAFCKNKLRMTEEELKMFYDQTP
ncbi:MAG: exodeoxyribonuclease VII small subunit [Bacteroidota bacterium]